MDLAIGQPGTWYACVKARMLGDMESKEFNSSKVKIVP